MNKGECATLFYLAVAVWLLNESNDYGQQARARSSATQGERECTAKKDKSVTFSLTWHTNTDRTQNRQGASALCMSVWVVVLLFEKCTINLLSLDKEDSLRLFNVKFS